MHKATMFNFTVQDQKKKSNEGGRGLGGKKNLRKKNIEPIFGKVNVGDKIKKTLINLK